MLFHPRRSSASLTRRPRTTRCRPQPVPGESRALKSLAAILAWKTVQIRSTQSATGILYVALALILFGELASLVSARGGGLIG